MKRSFYAGVTLATLSLVALTGCSHDDNNGDNNNNNPSASSSPSASEGKGAYQDLAKPTCSKDAKGQWSATGTLKNADAEKKLYTVTASIVNAKTHQVISAKTKEVTIEGNKSAPLAMDKFYTTPAKNKVTEQCIVGVYSKKA